MLLVASVARLLFSCADFASRYPDSLAGMSHLTVSQQRRARPPERMEEGNYILRHVFAYLCSIDDIHIIEDVFVNNDSLTTKASLANKRNEEAG
jgi:hypothetical protein